MNKHQYQVFVDILHKELIPALGCTEPISLAYAAAKARDVLGELPGTIDMTLSGNIIKNVKGVTVPGTAGMKGIEAAIAIGIVAGDAQKKLEVLSGVQDADIEAAKAFLLEHKISIRLATCGDRFYLDLTLASTNHSARIVIRESHLNITLLEKDGRPIPVKQQGTNEASGLHPDYALLNIRDILAFAEHVALPDISPAIERQVRLNMAIAQEGMQSDRGANIGKVLSSIHNEGDVCTRAASLAAAASDARMSGCEMPVVIVSGSGNQGITASVPVAVYAEHYQIDEEQLYRALVVSNLTTVHLKTGIGSLSAFCGVVIAGCGAAAGIAYLVGGGYCEVSHTIVNSLGMVSGMVCDGAKPSCAAKIAASVQAGILGYEMYRLGNQFHDGEGIISKGVENTIKNIVSLANDGMRETDQEILRIMTQNG